MRITDRYVLRQLLVVAALVTVTLTSAIWLTQSLRFIELIVNRGLTLATFFQLTVLLLPSFLWLMLPIATFTATLFVYSRLVGDSELIAMRVAGLGPLQLARPALVLSVSVAAIVYAIALYFLPLSYRAFKDLDFNVRNDYSGVLLREGAFNVMAPNVTVYFRARETSGDLTGIIVHDSRKPEARITIVAQLGRLAVSEEGPRVVLQDGNRQEFDPETGRLRLLYFDRYSVDLGKLAARNTDRWREPRERFLHELFGPPVDDNDRQYRSRLLAEGHNRLISPIIAITYAFVALAALLTGDLNRRGQGKRVIVAIALAVLLQTGQITAQNLITKWPAMTPLVYVLALGAPAIAVWWLARTPRRHGLARWMRPAAANA
jgi:lipopolysaccharide export system permease protein